eukprot:CAMPEP_0175972298 /NCGR_PEP_ID=MMETSP0108-20121206/42145_1 /TAXON_ID=195067 ORGANISM="Goniomonas pacifica, Strain CCMP1869" /NCGR_SAMPLE_ID=MMETSP0108 /ASSEMBLY_ACC=CAM_ASM_000204 /LENGTH=507 /DNA_ID=CAMNT_0017301587 /DNA_START=284 /DNA_END=1807 /DNA_ORIENTATION=+
MRGTDFFVAQEQEGRFLQLGKMKSGRLNLTIPPIWPGGADHAPLICPRGSHGQRGQIGFQCIPCREGTYAPDIDATSCQVCPEGASCPFASAWAFKGSEWTVTDESQFPRPVQTLGSADTRFLLLVGVTSVGAGLVVVFLGIVAVFLHGQGLRLASKRTRVVAVLKRCDILFQSVHYQMPYTLLSRYPTVLGGVMTVVCMICGIGVCVYILGVSLWIDAWSLEYYTEPGLTSFIPKQDAFRVTLYAVGIDRGLELCDDLCTQGLLEWSSEVSWDVRCSRSIERGGCRVDATPKSDSMMQVETFWFRARLPQTRLHAWQWRLESGFQSDGTVYSSSSNITAREGSVLAGGSTRVLVELRPTSYSGTTGIEDEGFVPLLVSVDQSSALRTSTLDSLAYNDLLCSFDVHQQIHRFSVTSLVEYFVLVSLLFASSNLTRRGFVVLVFVYSWIFRRDKSVRFDTQLCSKLKEPSTLVVSCDDSNVDATGTDNGVWVWMPEVDSAPDEELVIC